MRTERVASAYTVVCRARVRGWMDENRKRTYGVARRSSQQQQEEQEDEVEDAEEEEVEARLGWTRKFKT